MTAPDQQSTDAVPAEAEVVPIAPASPDAFRLAGETPRVMRLSRKTLAVIGGVGGLAIAASLMWALRTPAPAERQELYEANNNARPDAVSGAPADYGAVPKLGSSLEGEATKLAEIPGLVPSLKNRIQGCVFAGRCPKVTDLCRQVAPGLEAKAANHIVACHHAAREAVAA